MLRFISFSFWGLLFVSYAPVKLTQTIKEANIRFDLPSEEWFYAEKIKNGSKSLSYVYKRQPIELDEEEIIPMISIMVEELAKDVDKDAYLKELQAKTEYKITEQFGIESGKFTYSAAICFKATYIDVMHEHHTVYMLNGYSARSGFQMILDANTDVMPQVEKEFLAVLKSVR